jgi:hypothetical protein
MVGTAPAFRRQPAERSVGVHVLPEIKRDAADDAAWQVADNQWLRDNLQPPLQREHFQVAEIAEALARLPGRPEVDAQLRRSITNDLYEWIERREFAEEDVLMLVGGSKLCVPFPLDEVLNNATRKLIVEPLAPGLRIA